MKIKKIIVIGCGGTGGFLIPALSRYLFSLKYKEQLVLVDGDNYSKSNAERQVFSSSKTGCNKAEYQYMAIDSQLPDFAKQVQIIPEYVGKKEIEELVEEGTVVFNCVDNNAPRKFVEERMLKLKNCIHICPGNDMTTGQVQISMRIKGQQILPSILKKSPEFNSENSDRSKMSCEEISKLDGGGQVICANMTAATICLNAFVSISKQTKMLKHGNMLTWGTVFYNCVSSDFRKEDLLTV